MADYKIVLRKSVAKEIDGLQRKDRKRIVEKILSLTADPRPLASKKLSGEEKYRIRQSVYRVLYQILDQEVIVIVVKVGHR